tara:strand:- start:2913 stop:3098 length:186 start_codon:yes stop_codon:yes gene_type:complete
MAKLMDLPENLMVLMSGLLSKTVTVCPILRRYIANREPTNPEPMMAMFFGVCAIIAQWAKF